MFYVYVWRDSAGNPFYVGKGKGGRANDVRQRSDSFKAIHSKGGCYVEIVDEFIHESQAFSLECELIERYGRRAHGGTLVNLTDGGEGSSGASPSEATRAILSETSRKSWLDDDIRRRRIAALKICGANPEVRARKSASVKATFSSPEMRSRLRLLRLEDQGRLETKEKLRAVMVARLAIPGEQAKITAAVKAAYTDPAVRERLRHAERMKPPSASNKSGFKGVSLDQRTQSWASYINPEGRKVHLGRFPSPEIAARAYDAAAIAAWGYGNCYLNFPEEHSVCVA